MTDLHVSRERSSESSSVEFAVGDEGDDDSDEEEDYDEEEEEGSKKEEVDEEEYLSPEDKVRKIFERKGMKLLDYEPRWRETVRQQMECELTRRVREALETPPLERIQKRNDIARQQRQSPDLNGHLLLDLSDKERDFLKVKRWKALQAKKLAERGEMREMTYLPHAQKNVQVGQQIEFMFRDELSRSNHDEYPGVFGLNSLSEGIKNIRDEYSVSVSRYPGVKPKIRHFYTKEGFIKALRTGNLPAGVQFLDERGTYIDKYGVIRNNDGPFWPVESVPLFATPRFKWWTDLSPEPLVKPEHSNTRTTDTRTTEKQEQRYKGKWRGVQVAYDSDRSPRDFNPLPVPEGCCPTLQFESRFECGNLRQARRVGQFEYELVLKTDLYTARHTQWYYFRVSNTVRDTTYKFRIVNLLKRNSLYSEGMRPLLYSENDAKEKQRGWIRAGHGIKYSRNSTNHNSPLLLRGVAYYMLEWHMEFDNEDDTYYLAHCYPYSFTDLKEDLEVLMNSEERSQVTRREVMCETRAGNSCFLLTVTNFESKEEKKAVVITARVHPGESQASWMMKGLLEFITGPDPLAKELRKRFIFKIVPMINPDGVIVGNYRCSLAARDLNRNYRHPRRENFPTVWYLKNMVDDVSKKHEIALYCDLHGHSRKPNVFMYGNNTSSDGDRSPLGMARAFISERLFPWLMSVRSPDKFHFKSCKFHIRRCKESTGRVVMWRQMRVFNSFTLEATFSGTEMDKDNARHFNILDFMEMGKVLAQAVLDYQNVQEDQAQQTKTVLDLTRVITEQVLTSKGLIEPNTAIPDFDVHKGTIANDAAKVQESAEKWTGALLALLNTPREVTQQPSAMSDVKAKMSDESKTVGGEDETRPVYTRDDVIQMLEKLSGGRSMDDCLGLLAQLDVQDAILESDSSDSDSESEPEMKPPEPKTRKKKRKSKKQRDKDKQLAAGGEKKSAEEQRSKSVSKRNSLPDIVRLKATSTNEKLRNTRQVSGFISKYEGRHNGGVPCFTEERSMERAAKRMAELRRRHEDDKSKEMTFYCVDETGMHQFTQEDLINQRLQELGEGNPNISTAMLSMNVRTGYTHADNLQELSPAPSQPMNGVNSYLMSTISPNSYHPGSDYHDLSSSEGSDNNSDENHNHKALLSFPVTARRNPYHQLEPLEPRPTSDLSIVRLSHPILNTTSGPVAGISGNSLPIAMPATTTTTTTTLPSSLPPTTSLAASTTMFSNGLSLSHMSPLTVNPFSISSTTTATTPTGSASSTSKTYEQSGSLKGRQGESSAESTKLLRRLKDNHRQQNGISRSDTLASMNPGAINSMKNAYHASLGPGAMNEARSDGGENTHVIGNLNSQQKPTNVGQLVNQLAQNLTGIASPLPVAKRHLRYKYGNSPLRSLSRNGQSLPAMSPLMTSSIVPGNRLVLPESLASPRVDDKTRLGGRSGNGVRSNSQSQSPYQSQGYTWS